MALAKGVCV